MWCHIVAGSAVAGVLGLLCTDATLAQCMALMSTAMSFISSQLSSGSGGGRKEFDEEDANFDALYSITRQQLRQLSK